MLLQWKKQLTMMMEKGANIRKHDKTNTVGLNLLSDWAKSKKNSSHLVSISQPELSSCGSALQLFARLSSVELAIVKKIRIEVVVKVLFFFCSILK